MLFTNIHSKGLYPANKLSNFTAHAFTFDSVPVASMESLLQSFKFQEKERQQEICRLSAKEAKAIGSEQRWNGYLFWNGVVYRRKGYEYRNLLTKAYDEMARNNPSFRTALIGSAPILVHTIGKWRRSQTCLTWWEFCFILTRLRKRLRA